MSALGHRLRAYVRPSFGGPIGTIAGCQLWFDSSDASSFTYSSGSIVSQWNDKSGNGRHASQADTAKQPVRDFTWNSLSVVAFKDAGDWLNNTGYTMPSANTVLAVTGRRVGTSYFQWISGPDAHMSLFANPTGTVRINTVDTAVGATTVPESTQSLLTTTATTSAQTVRFNRASDGTSSTASTFTGAGFALGAGNSTGSFPGNGYLGELLLYDSVLSTTDRDALETYLRDKWATP